MQAFTVTFETERETKNTIRYAEVVENGQPPKIGTLYVQKWVLGQDPPNRLVVTVTEDA